MIFSTKELVKLALCYIILMASLSKCEIDSSALLPITTTATARPPKSVQPVENAREKSKVNGTSLNAGAFSILPSGETVKASYSNSSSSSYLRDDGKAVVAVFPFNNSNENRPQQQQQQADGPYNSRIINGTITPSLVPPILTSSVPHTPLQEAADSDGALEKKQGQQQEQRQNNFVKVQSRGSSDNEGQAGGDENGTFSSSSDTNHQQQRSSYNNNNNNINHKYYDKMSTRVGSNSPAERKASSTETEAKLGTTAGRSLDSLAIIPQRQLSSSLPRRRLVNPFSGLKGERRSFPSSFSQGTEGVGLENERESESFIPTHTWIPAGLSFSCKNRVPGYYADASPLSKCQVYHMCMTDGRKYTLLCGIGTVFNQLTFVCDHWYNYKCAEAESDYKINRKLWLEFVGDENTDKDEDELEDHNQDNDQTSEEAIIENDAVHQSVPLRSPFTAARATSVQT